jgi:hypothetical protein
MTREAIIQKTIKTLSRLPADKVVEVSDFADYMLKKYEENRIQDGIERLVEQSHAFQFLNDEEDLYSAEDIKEKY